MMPAVPVSMSVCLLPCPSSIFPYTPLSRTLGPCALEQTKCSPAHPLLPCPHSMISCSHPMLLCSHIRSSPAPKPCSLAETPCSPAHTPCSRITSLCPHPAPCIPHFPMTIPNDLLPSTLRPDAPFPISRRLLDPWTTPGHMFVPLSLAVHPVDTPFPPAQTPYCPAQNPFPHTPCSTAQTPCSPCPHPMIPWSHPMFLPLNIPLTATAGRYILRDRGCHT